MASNNISCRVFSRGFYSCNWMHPSDRKRRCACCWFSVVTLASLITLCWMYICLVTFNDREDINWKGFAVLKLWVNWFMVLTIVSAVLTSYCVLLLLFALFQVALSEPLDLHWLHKILLFLGVLFVAVGVTAISLQWGKEWPTVLLSFQATAPFLQMGGVGALTMLSWMVFQSFHRANRLVAKILIILTFAGVSAVIFLSPLLIRSPCLVDEAELPPKPALIGHRGAPMLAPENTMMSFRKSVACNVTAFETDVQVSKDRVPFLMHDHDSGFLRRTTNVTEVFPGQDFSHSTNLTWEKLQTLNAGDWFLKTDPFYSVSQISKDDRETARIQKIPSLHHLLDLAREHNISIIFDLKNEKRHHNDTNNDTIDTVSTILSSGIAQHLVLWLPNADREYVKEAAPGFTQVYNNTTDMENEGGHHLNLNYNALSVGELRNLWSSNVSVNLWVVNERWLFSLLWCAGTSSVTTNSCHLLKDMTRPDWTLGPKVYCTIWMAVDLMSMLIMFGLFFLQRKKSCYSHSEGGNRIELSPLRPK